MRPANKIASLLYLSILIGFCFTLFSCSNGDDYDDDSGYDIDDDDNDASDDDDNDDDDADDDLNDDLDDDVDDDDIDDDTVEPKIELIDGGSPGFSGATIALSGSQTAYVTAVSGRDLIVYELNDTDIVSEKVASFADFPILATDAAENIYVGYVNLASGTLAYAARLDGQWSTHDSGIAVSQPYRIMFSFAVGADGKAHFSYVPKDGDRLWYASNSSRQWESQAIGEDLDNGVYSSIAIDSEGYAHISHCWTLAWKLQYSTNAQGGWNTEIVGNEEGVGYSTSIAVDEMQRVHISYVNMADNSAQYASNSGGGWFTENAYNPIQDDTPTSIAIGANGETHILLGGIIYLKRSDGGWQEVFRDLDGGNDIPCDIAVDQNDNAHMTYFDSVSYALIYMNYGGGDSDRRTVDQENNVGMDVVMAIDAQGGLHLAYQDVTNLNLKYASSSQEGWQIEVADPLEETGMFCDIAIDNIGQVLITHFDNFEQALRLTLKHDGEWSSKIIDDASSVGWGSSVAVDEDGFYHVSYLDVSRNNLKYANNISGDWANVVIGPASGTFRTSLVFDSQNYPHIAYQNDEVVYHATNSSGEWIIETVDEDDEAGGYISAAIDSGDALHISYQQGLEILSGQGADLRYATNSGGFWEVFELSDDEFTGYFTNLAIDDLDNIHLIYSEVEADAGIFTNLTYVTNLSGEWLFSPIDQAGEIGINNSIGLTPDGRIHAAYFGQTALWHASFPQGWTGAE